MRASNWYLLILGLAFPISMQSFLWPPRNICSATDLNLIKVSANKIVNINYKGFRDIAQLNLDCDLKNIFVVHFGKTMTLVGSDDPKHICSHLGCINMFNNTYLEYEDNKVIYLIFDFSAVQIIDQNINITRVAMISQRNITVVLFKNSNGFKLTLWPFLSTLNNVIVYFQRHTLAFYSNENLIDAKMCLNFIKNGIVFNETTMFSFYSHVSLVFRTQIDYQKDICPLVFKNARILYLGLFGLSTSALVNNAVKFMQLDDMPINSSEKDCLKMN